MRFLETLEEVLKKDERFVGENGRIVKAAVYDAAMRTDHSLLELLIRNQLLKQHFFVDLEGTLVFDKVKFSWVVESREFLPDSYTLFKNKVGLMDNRGRILSQQNDVALVWPYKDCVLEGGQTKEDQKRDEIFYNEILAPDEVSRLLYPKVLTNAKRYSKKGVFDIREVEDKDNLIIKGNNLLAISSLLKRIEGKVQCICIDPPYNKQTDEFDYNDTFNHSTWLTFMKTRLEHSFRLLNKNGTIFVFCDDSEQPYLKVLMDEIMGRDRYIQTIIWRNSDNSNNDADQFSQDHNYILVYSKNPQWESLKLDRTPEQTKHYRNPDNDPRGPWFDGNPVNSPNLRKNLKYVIHTPNGSIIQPPANGWRWKPDELKRRMETGEIRFNSTETNIIRRTYLYEQKGLPPSSLWDILEVPHWLDIKETGHTRQAKYEQKKLYPNVPTSQLFKTPKPEKVIEKIIRISTAPGDLVVDYFGGSGTTAAVAHKMGRHYILCEQMDYISSFTVPRMMKVINGEQGGISKNVNWNGGGSFVYCELMEKNEAIVSKLQAAGNTEDVLTILNQITDEGLIIPSVLPAELRSHMGSIDELPLEHQKQLVMELVDKNRLYVNLCDIDDEEVCVSEQDKAFTRSFYGLYEKGGE